MRLGFSAKLWTTGPRVDLRYDEKPSHFALKELETLVSQNFNIIFEYHSLCIQVIGTAPQNDSFRSLDNHLFKGAY